MFILEFVAKKDICVFVVTQAREMESERDRVPRKICILRDNRAMDGVIEQEILHKLACLFMQNNKVINCLACCFGQSFK